MTDVDEVIKNLVLAHRTDYDPVAAREYYLRTRKLKGRKRASPANVAGQQLRRSVDSKLGKKPKRIEEDEVPERSPSGAKIVDYDGKGSGKAYYSDGSVYDGNGWHKGKLTSSQRISAAQGRINEAKRRARRSSGEERQAYLRQIAILQKRLDAAKAKLSRSSN